MFLSLAAFQMEIIEVDNMSYSCMTRFLPANRWQQYGQYIISMSLASKTSINMTPHIFRKRELPFEENVLKRVTHAY